MIVTVLLLVAALAGVAGAVSGNRAAWALLASLLLCLALSHFGVAFNLAFWTLIDIIVAVVVIRRGMPAVDMLIVALFPVAWAAYLLPDPWRFYGTLAVVVAQLFMTFPFGPLYRRWKVTLQHRDEWTNFDPCAAA